jgi:hypothetical protein
LEFLINGEIMKLDFCALCGATNPDCLEQHHFIPKVEGGTDDESNMFTVCGTCHGRIHDVPRPLRLRPLIQEGIAKAKKRNSEVAQPRVLRKYRISINNGKSLLPNSDGRSTWARISTKRAFS